jgi:hypothetical protein
MHFTRAFLMLLCFAVLGAGYWHYRGPDAADTPREGIEVAAAQVDRRAASGRGADTPAVPSTAAAPVDTGGGGGGGDPLQQLIAAKGGTCAAVVAVEALDPASGLYAVTCRTASGVTARFRVDTRQDGVEPIVA